MATVAVEGALVGTEAIVGAIGGAGARASIAGATRAMGSAVFKAVGKHGFDILNIAMMGMMSMPPEHHDAPVPIKAPPPVPIKAPPPVKPTPTVAVAKFAAPDPPPPDPPPPKAPVIAGASGGAGTNEPTRVYNESHQTESKQATPQIQESSSAPIMIAVVLGGGALVLFYFLHKSNPPT